MSCERGNTTIANNCFHGIYVKKWPDPSNLSVEPCTACNRFKTQEDATKYLKSLLCRVDEFPDQMFPDLPPKNPVT